MEAIEGRGWTSLGTKEGVELYNNPSSEFPATRGVAVVEAHPLLLHALYADTVHRKEWYVVCFVYTVRQVMCVLFGGCV